MTQPLKTPMRQVQINLCREGEFITRPLHDAPNVLLLQAPHRLPRKQLHREHDFGSRMLHPGAEAAERGPGKRYQRLITQPHRLPRCTSFMAKSVCFLSAFIFLGPETDCTRSGMMRGDAESGSCWLRAARSQGFPRRGDKLSRSCQAVRPSLSQADNPSRLR